MNHRQVVLLILLPPDEQPSKAVHPGMRPLDHPAPRPIPGDVGPVLGLFAPRPNVRRIPPRLHQVAHLVVIIPFIQAQMLGIVLRGFRPPDGQRLQGRLDQFEVVHIGTGDRHGQRHPRPIGQQTAFRAQLRAICGIGPGTFFPPTAL